MIRTILISKAGAAAAGFNSFRNNEYKITVVPRIIDQTCIHNAYDEAVSFCQSTFDQAPELPSRMTLVRLLEDDSLAGSHVVLCSHDVATRIHSKLLEKHIDTLLAEHSDADVISLIADDSIEYEALDFVTPDTEISFSDSVPPHKSAAFALVIPSSKRHKLADIISNSAVCIPDAVRYGSLARGLKVYYPSENLMWRHNVVSRAEKKKLSVVMMSYKRPKDLLRQILSMFNQTYQDFKMYVAVKGMTEKDFQLLVIPHVVRFLQEGRLSLQYFPNKNQLSNLIDCVRFSDLDKTSLCVKIDDDDIYHPKFLEHLMILHAGLPADVGSYYDGYSWELKAYGTHKGVSNYKSDWPYGNSIVFPAEMFADLQSIERNPHNVNERYSRRVGFREDEILIDLCKDNGAIDRTKFFEMAGWCNDVIVDRSESSSVSRESSSWYLSEEFKSANDYINTDDSACEHTIAIKTSAGVNTAAVMFDKEIMMLDPIRTGAVMFHDIGHEVGVRWDDGEEDVYKRDKHGVFKSIDLA